MDPFTEQLIPAVGMTLVHFLWQGAAIGIITAAVLAACPRATARTRYGIAGAGLAAMMTAPLVTLRLVWQAAPAMMAVQQFSTTATVTSSGSGSLAMAVVSPWLPTAVAFWATGVLLLTGRLLRSWWRTEQVRRRDVRPATDGLTAAVRRLSRELGLRRVVALFESPWVDAPTVIGWLRPTILLPVGALTGLSVQQIEAVLSHELAHIKRHDYLVNVLQNMAETIFFYHPAVWWVSKQIRIEREHCCDDVAVEACGSPVMYARALALLEESRIRRATFALAATDGSLVNRVRRIVGPVRADQRRPSLPIAACVALILTLVALGAAQAQADTAATIVDLPVAEAVHVAAPGGTIAPDAAEAPRGATQQDSPRGAVPFERVDANTINVEGVPYRRGTTDDLTRLVTPETAQQPRDSAPQTTPAFPPNLPPPPQEAAPLRVGGDIRPPSKIRDVPPVYPEQARAAGISGVVILEATIDPEGIPVSIVVLRSIPELDQAAINAVRQWRYTPTLLNGSPVAVMMTVTVNFTLQDARESYEEMRSRYETLLREMEATRVRRETAPQGTQEEVDARSRALELERVRLEQQLNAYRRRLEAAEAASSSGRSVVGGAVNGAATNPIRVGGTIPAPRKIRDVPPVYPKIARAAKVSGIVIITATIDEEGNVTNPRILRSVPMLDNAALEAVRQWKYEPTLVNAVPTPVQTTMTVNFTLN